MLNPIEHSKTKELANKYTVEPYVVAADVYGAGNLIGKGGWTWYTGSSSWMYIAGIKYILGINISGDELKIEPHIPNDWKEYMVRLNYEKSLYNIKIKKSEKDEKEIRINGEIINTDTIKMNKDGGVYNIEVEI